MQGWAGLILLGCFVTSCLAGGWSEDEDDEMDCQGDVCFEKYQYLQTVKNNVAGGLKYQEKLSARAESRDLVSVCLPGVNEKFVAFLFNSCSEKKGEEVCIVQKRGWLKSNGKHLVPNKEELLSNLAALPGGDEAVRTCLELAPEYQYEQYEVYDYADYGADWDYLEESGARAVRKRRAAAAKKDGGEEQKPKNNGNKKKNPKKGGRKGKKKGKGPGQRKKGGKDGKGTGKREKKPKGKKKGGKTRKGNKGENKKDKKKKKPSKGDKNGKLDKKEQKQKDKQERKAEKAADRKAAKEEKKDAKAEKQSGVSKATMAQLSCVEEKIAELLAACGEKLLA